MDTSTLITYLNDPDRVVRLGAVNKVGRQIRNGVITRRKQTIETNCHIHTQYSFGPDFPAQAAFQAWDEGLETLGSADHNSFSAAKEMKHAGAQIGIGTTVAIEVRVDFSELGFGDVRINNPDTNGNAYVLVHGIPIIHEPQVTAWLNPINVARNERNEAMVHDLNSILSQKGLPSLDFRNDVWSISQANEGGAITERTILFPVSQRILAATRPDQLVRYLTQDLGITGIDAKTQTLLEDPAYAYRDYRLLGLLKSSFLPLFYRHPNSRECPPSSELIKLADSVSGLSTYAYLGDILVKSVTGDKKAQPFEDAYLHKLMPALYAAGYRAIAYMLPRSEDAQIAVVRGYCGQYVFMEINGIDRNSPEQDWHCKKLLYPENAHLRETSWALVGHEHEVNNGGPGMLAEGRFQSTDALNRAVAKYAAIGRASVEQRK